MNTAALRAPFDRPHVIGEIRRPFEAMKDQLFPWRPPYMATVEHVLSDAECDALIARTEADAPCLATINRGNWQEVNTSIRNNDRVIFDDNALAALLWQRLLPAVPTLLEESTAVGMNERFRSYRYSPGQRFAPHFDGAFIRDAFERSRITVLVYLNEGFIGGETAFADAELNVTPKKGMALMFEHAILHEGCVVHSGRKYALRTDVMYRSATAAPSRLTRSW